MCTPRQLRDNCSCPHAAVSGVAVAAVAAVGWSASTGLVATVLAALNVALAVALVGIGAMALAGLVVVARLGRGGRSLRVSPGSFTARTLYRQQGYLLPGDSAPLSRHRARPLPRKLRAALGPAPAPALPRGRQQVALALARKPAAALTPGSAALPGEGAGGVVTGETSRSQAV
jgi:hypothetical protein